MKNQKFVEDKSDVIKNCIYIIENIDNQYIKQRIYSGRYFIKYIYNNVTYFFPNKFIAYNDNNIEKHKNNRDVNYGTYCKSKIETALGKKYKENDIIELEYQKFCNNFQIPTTIDGNIPKFLRQYIVLED